MTDTSLKYDVPGFLESCRESSQTTWENFKRVLADLENPATQKAVRVFLAALEQHCNTHFKNIQMSEVYWFSFERLAFGRDEGTEEAMTLLQMPGIFAPEEWSFTFFEGLARLPVSEFQNRTIVELGSGNGWISIALAKRCVPLKMIGLDINPRATTCARINLYLNGLNAQGEKTFDADVKTLLDRVEFHTSDLLQHCLQNKIMLDRVIGCIPQVLSPNPDIAQKIISGDASDEELYALSNYCGRQGFIEDQFGLGLIARALEEGIETTRPSAKFIFNLGGRPGAAILRRLFARRGFRLERIWETRVIQAPDTDIAPLVEIERSSPHRFEFFMGLSSPETISARTAFEFAKSGGAIAHSLGVYQATPEFPAQIAKILKLAAQPGFEGARSALDLAFEDKAVGEEKISFLADLAQRLEQENFPYHDTRGEQNLRRRLAEFMRSYHNVPFSARNIVVAPSRLAALKNIFQIYRPVRALVDTDLTRGLPQEWTSNESEGTHPFVVEAPRSVDLVCRLATALNPQLIVMGLADFEQKTGDSFRRILEISAEIGARLVIDISSFFELSSTPQRNGVFQYLSEQPLPMHAMICCALVKNKVYPDFELSFVASENLDVLVALSSAAELTYSRTPILTQNYYDRILFDLLSFQLRSVRNRKTTNVRHLQTESDDFKSAFGIPGKTALLAFAHSSLKETESLSEHKKLRLDYGENALASPLTVKASVFESFVRQNLSEAECDPDSELHTLLQQRFGVERTDADIVVYGGGVAPLFAGLMEACALANGTLILPEGHYGYFAAAALFFGVKIKYAATHPSADFKLTVENLKSVMKGVERPWLFLNIPVVNPTGAIYSHEELDALLNTVENENAKVILDTSFSGLEFQKPKSFSLERYFSKKKNPKSAPQFILLGGISKEFAAGGLRMGYAYTRDSALAEATARGQTLKPHKTLRYVLKEVLSKLNSNNEELLQKLEKQRNTLELRAKVLQQTLQECGWEVLAPKGGLFLVARPSQYLGRQWLDRKSGKIISLDENNLQAILLQQTNLLVNPPEWTGLPGYCRFVLSVTEEEFQEALVCLRNFAEEVDSKGR